MSLKVFPPLILFFVFLSGVGSYLALFRVPPDSLQGEVQRIMYIHVPSAWIGLSFIVISAVFSLIYLFKRRSWADEFAWSFAKVGATFTFLALITGMLWARPIWGVWWVWDARLTTTAILFMIYIAYLLLGFDTETKEKNKKARAVLSVIGAGNVPLVWFSVKIWRTLHQGYSIIKKGGPSIAPEMLKVLLFNIAVIFVLATLVAVYDALLSIRNRVQAHPQKIQP